MADHDAGYRRLFSDKRMVADLISGFVDEPWVENLDLDTLERISGSLVSDDFSKRKNDVIWRVKFRDRWLYVYLLIEFQSTVDRYMALRLMVYVGLLYQRLIDEKLVGGQDLLPPVLPMVLYNGERRWSAPLEVADLIAGGPGGLNRFRPRLRYFLLEEQARPDAELSGMRNLAATVFRLEKSRTQEDIERVFAAFADWAATAENREAITRIAEWLERIVLPHRGSAGKAAVLDDIREYGAMLKERVKQWEQDARDEGLKEGIERGIERGEAHVLVRLIEQKFGPLSDDIRGRIDAARSQQILAWAERILTAERLEDVFQ